MVGDPIWLRRLVEDMPQECDAWRKVGIGFMAIGGALAFSVWATVRSHPEQDLPLWPAWIFAALACLGLLLTATTLLHLPPFRDSPRNRDI